MELGVHATELAGAFGAVALLYLDAAHRKRRPRRPHRSEAFPPGFGLVQHLEVDLGVVHALHAADVRVTELLERVQERTRTLDASGGIDDLAAHPGDVVLFVMSALSLIPLAWLIGEATEHAGEHTGPRIGGLLNASFGNAPEVIIALIAVADNLPNVVRGSMAGSVVSNILLVLGAALVLGPDNARLNRQSLLMQLGLVLGAVLLLLIPSIPGWHGNPDRHSLALLSIAPAVAMLVIYLAYTIIDLRRRKPHEPSGEQGWSLPVALVALGAATAATALISEILVHSLQAFADAANLSEFFIAAVIVAIVGNAARSRSPIHWPWRSVPSS